MSAHKQRVDPSGPEGAEILIIGEAPGSDETRLKQPFVGLSGQLLRSVLQANGFDCATAEDCESYGISINNKYNIRFMNLCNHQPLPDNKFLNLDGTEELKSGLRELDLYISKWKSNIRICIALGAEPLQYLAKKYGIEKWRGSVIQVYGLTILATYHPAYIVRFRTNYPVFTFDIGKAYKVYTEGYTHPKFNFTIDPSGYLAEECLGEILSNKNVSVDIETVKNTNRILCIGFGLSRTRAICIVNRSTDGLDPEVRRFVERVFDSKVELTFHNGLFDVEILHNNYLEAKNFSFDTMVAQHILAPELDKGLDFITSIYTDIPYYKDRGKMTIPENEKGWSNTKNLDKYTLYEYNCIDCAATYWCYEIMKDEIESDPDYKLIFKQEMEMHEVAFELTRNGMLRDETRTQELKKAIEAKYVQNQILLDHIVGKSINVGSPQQKKKLLYETWKLPERTGKNSKVSSDEDAIVSLISFTKDYISGLRREETKYEWQKKLAGLMLVLKLQGYRKLLGSYIDIDISSDGRIRSVYKLTGTETGRWSCSKYYDDTGLNGQTMPRESFEV